MVGSRVVVVGGGFVLAVAVLAAAAWTYGVRHEGGPLRGGDGTTTSCISARGSTDFSHTVAGLRNNAGRDARITGITLIGSEGLLLADAVVTPAESAPILARRWPPPGSSQLVWSGRQRAAGATVPSADNPDGPDAKRWDLVLRLRPADDRALARLGGVRVDYTVGSRRYKLTSEYRLAVVRTGECTVGDMAEPGAGEEQQIRDDGGS
jgi:hypothetical protein